MPRTRPRSTAQITGCSMAAPPNGQWSDTMRSPSPWRSAWAAKPWAVRASATAWSAVRNDRWHGAGGGRVGEGGGARPHGGRHRLAVLHPDLLGHRLGVVGRQERQRLAEQRDEQVVVADRHLEGHLGRRDAVALRRPPGPGAAAAGGDLDVAAAGQLVEVVPGDVGVQGELLGHLGGRDTGVVLLAALVHEEVDLPAGGVAERRGDRRHGARELRRGEAGRHRPVFYLWP